MSGRRINGEGSVYQRKSDGLWVGAVTLGYDENGHQRRKTVSAKTRSEALAKVRAMQRQVDEGLPPPDGTTTVGVLLDRWFADVLRHQVAKTALENYRTVADRHIRPALGRKRLATLTPVDVDRLLSAKLDEGYSVSTVRRIRAVLSQSLDQAARWGLVARNVAGMTRGSKAKRTEGRTLTPEQARDRFEALYVTMLVLGLRRGEALGLRWEDVDLDRALLVVRRSLKREDGALVAGDVKTSKSRRSLNLPGPLVDLLRAHRAKQETERLALGPAWVESGHIFTTQLDTPIDPRNCYRDFVRLCEQLGLGRWHPHELRHSAALLMLVQGVPLEVVSDILAHSSIWMTADVYGHILAPQRQAAAEAMAAALWT
jgi:integrase